MNKSKSKYLPEFKETFFKMAKLKPQEAFNRYVNSDPDMACYSHEKGNKWKLGEIISPELGGEKCIAIIVIALSKFVYVFKRE
jgi:hypothetical protein